MKQQDWLAIVPFVEENAKVKRRRDHELLLELRVSRQRVLLPSQA